jgi:hypothetical protein
VAYWLVLTLLVWPEELPVPHQAPEPLWRALKEIAWTLELTGPRCPWITDFRSEVRWVRHHMRDAAEYPALTECQRLPPAFVIHDNLAFNRVHQCYLEARWVVRLQDRDAIEDALQQSRQISRIWEAMAAANADDLNWFCRRQALARLRELLGDEAYYEGDWPFPIPLGLVPAGDPY